MNMAQHQRWLAAALCVALAACSNMDSGRSTANTGYGNDGASSGSSMAGTTTSNPDGSSAMSPASSTSSAASTPAASSTAQITYGTVQSVDPMQRQDVGMGAVGAAAAGGTMGDPTDRVYRVAVRMDDGTTQTVVVDTKPSYKTGDRVRYSNGKLEQY